MGRLTQRGSGIVRGLMEYAEALASGEPVEGRFKVTALSRCECSFRQRGGHEPGCHRFPNPGPVGDRGTRHWVWHGDDENPEAASFAPFPGATLRTAVSVPVGWRLARDERLGVALESVFLDRLTAAEVCLLALAGTQGFRFVSTGPAE